MPAAPGRRMAAHSAHCAALPFPVMNYIPPLTPPGCFQLLPAAASSFLVISCHCLVWLEGPTSAQRKCAGVCAPTLPLPLPVVSRICIAPHCFSQPADGQQAAACPSCMAHTHRVPVSHLFFSRRFCVTRCCHFTVPILPVPRHLFVDGPPVAACSNVRAKAETAPATLHTV